MFVYLTYLVCAIASNQVCYRTVPTERPFLGTAACFREGEVSMPQWLEAHPGLRVDKVQCTPGNRPPAGQDAL